MTEGNNNHNARTTEVPTQNSGSNLNNSNSRVWHSTVTVDNRNTMPITSVNTTTGQDTDLPDGWATQRPNSNPYRLLRVPDHLKKQFRSPHGQWTCFFCWHVRTGTIIIGFWHLLVQLVVLSLIAVVMVHPEVLKNRSQTTSTEGHNLKAYVGSMQDVQAYNCSRTPCFLATQNGKSDHIRHSFPLSVGNLLTTHKLNSDDVNMALFITVCTFAMTLLLIFGASKGQPSHLMPFFFLQVFDFSISSLTIVGYMSSLPNMRQWILENEPFPFQNQLLAMNKKCLTFFLLLIFTCAFLIKAYCITVVWRCYKYLLRNQGQRWTMRTTVGGSAVPVDQESQTLVLGPDLPDYDTAVTDPKYRKKNTMFPEPPPTYDMAMAAQQAQSRILAEIQRSTDGGLASGGQSSRSAQSTSSVQ